MSVERFIRAVHRRMVLLRAVERLGLCALAACAACLILMPILIWRGQATTPLVAAALGAGLLAGLAWGVVSRPTQLAAAIEADRQLGFSDLLGTAWLLRQNGTVDPVEQMVLAMATARCRAASPSTVVLNRLGVRSWGGIALAGALVGGLGLLGSGGSNAEARVQAPRTWQEIEAAQDQADAAHRITTPDLRRAKPGNGSDDDDASSTPQTHTEDSTTAAATNSASENGAGGANDGTGAGAGHSASKTATQTPQHPITGGASNATHTGATGNGGGGASVDSGHGSGTSGASAGAGGTRRAAPVWRGQTWATDQQTARQALRSGQVPEAYRDLVREYFERN
jgi:hypothetical protein